MKYLRIVATLLLVSTILYPSWVQKSVTITMPNCKSPNTVSIPDQGINLIFTPTNSKQTVTLSVLTGNTVDGLPIWITNNKQAQKESTLENQRNTLQTQVNSLYSQCKSVPVTQSQPKFGLRGLAPSSKIQCPSATQTSINNLQTQISAINSQLTSLYSSRKFIDVLYSNILSNPIITVPYVADPSA